MSTKLYFKGLGVCGMLSVNGVKKLTCSGAYRRQLNICHPQGCLAYSANFGCRVSGQRAGSLQQVLVQAAPHPCCLIRGIAARV